MDRILRNPAYKGQFIYQKTQRVKPAHRLLTDRYRQNRKTSSKRRPPEEQINISIPAIIDPDLWQRVQEQLSRNSAFPPRNNKKHQYLLRGLIRCPRCGGTKGDYRLYRYNRTDAPSPQLGSAAGPALLARSLWSISYGRP